MLRKWLACRQSWPGRGRSWLLMLKLLSSFMQSVAARKSALAPCIRCNPMLCTHAVDASQSQVSCCLLWQCSDSYQEQHGKSTSQGQLVAATPLPLTSIRACSNLCFSDRVLHTELRLPGRVQSMSQAEASLAELTGLLSAKEGELSTSQQIVQGLRETMAAEASLAAEGAAAVEADLRSKVAAAVQAAAAAQEKLQSKQQVRTSGILLRGWLASLPE